MKLSELKDILFINCNKRGASGFFVEYILVVIALLNHYCATAVELAFKVTDDHF